MSDTVVIQSHRSPLPYAWLSSCIKSVEDWSGLNNFEYRFLGDELFQSLPANIIEKTQNQKVVATDLARLLVIRQALNDGANRVVWFDADFFIFEPAKFVLPDKAYVIGREVWIQLNNKHKLQAYTKVHNAFLMFKKESSFLDFYIDTASKLLLKNNGRMPPQFIGPKLLTALHNVVGLSVLETAGMLSPLLIKDIIQGKGKALDLFRRKSQQVIYGANLCCSSIENRQVVDHEMEVLIKCLSSDVKIFT